MKPRSLIPILALILLTVFATAFALINYSNPVKVWPLPRSQPLTLVIGLSFVLGASVSALLVTLLQQQRASRPSPTTPERMPGTNVPEREHTSRI